MVKKEKILHPVNLFFLIWLAVSILYSLKLSSLFLYDFDKVLYVVGCGMLIPFLISWALFWVYKESSRGLVKSNKKFSDKFDFENIEEKLKKLLYIWIFGTILEIYFSEGLPIIWLYTGSEKTYMDFGLASIHGLLNSLISAISTIYFWIFLKNGNKTALVLALLAIVWAIFAVARQLIILNFIQILVLYFLMRGISKKKVIMGIASILATIILFGVMGDSRSGSNAINSVGYIESFPEWLPSGFLWVYIYMTSPINNLLYTVDLFPGVPDLGLANTLSTLIPTVLRVELFPKGVDFVPLVSEQLNMSSAYYGPYRDMGILGMIIYSIVLSIISCHYWFQNDDQSLLKYAVLAQCIIGSIFYNSLFFLPSIFQIIWIIYIFKNNKN
jgi:oligosaccharide repeat unit polymerase